MDYHNNATREQEMSMKLPHCYPKPTNLHKPSLHNNSHTISKYKPKIRIIHIIAPEIIKTDAANFRELVQRLTGRPSEQIDNFLTTKKKKLVAKNIVHGINFSNTNNNVLNSIYHHHHHDVHINNQRQDTRFFPCGFIGDHHEYHDTTEDNNGLKVIKYEDEATWGVEKTDNMLRGFTDLDDFIQEMVEFPLLPF